MKLRWNMREFEALRRQSSTVSRLSREATSVRDRCGAGYTASVIQGRTRARANVAAYTYDARDDNARNQTLLRAIGGGL